ncbi:MAG: PTS sugar transporter subunit IIB [Lachnospiraceae bacterium]
MKDLKVLTVCGAGVGTSTLLRMNINEAFRSFQLPFHVKVENTSLSRAKGATCDLMVTFESFAADARKCCPDVIVIQNLMDKNELKEKIGEYLKSKNII